MDFKVIFKDPFIDDLEHIVRSVAFHNPDAARRLGEQIIRMAEHLSFFPKRYPKVQQRPGIRRFIAKKHFKMFYRINYESRTVEILRCWDARQELDPLF